MRNLKEKGKENEGMKHRSSLDVVISDVAQLRGSLPLAQLGDDEIVFFNLIEEGDVKEVERFLSAHPTLDVNCVNYKGQTALSIAVKGEREDMVKLLFQQPHIDIKDTVLLATETGNVELTRTIIDSIKVEYPGREMEGCEESPNFSPDITPIMLAAQGGDYRMIRMFLSRGHRIEEPHPPTCLCPKCKTLIREAGSSRIRLSVYKAVCNPAYICQVTDDPMLYGFLIDEQLKECALMDKEFRAEYDTLGKGVREFLVALLSECRNPSEIETLLKLPFGFDVEYERAHFPRLQLAVDHHQKEFVAHSMVQQVLTAHWLGEFRSWPRLSFPRKCLHVLMRVLFLPVLCFTLMTIPQLKCLKKYHSPLNRFLMSLSSFILFLFLVFLLNLLDTGRTKRGPPTTGIEVIVVIFVLGFIWSTMRRYWAEGARRFFTVVWNWYDIVLEGTFVLTFFYWVKSMMDVVTDHINKKKPLERKFWSSGDATLIHEGFFALGTVLTFGKGAYYCLQSSRLGPLQVSMGKMAFQIGIFLILCMAINSSFAIPLTRMYAYYDGMTQTNAKGETRTQLSSFSNLPNSFLTLFWGMFGMSPVESTEVVIENLTPDKKNPVINHHFFTQGVGLLLFATYELLMVIALVNTLIAILSNTFQNIIDNADVEFKFARTKLWMYFFDDSTLFPSPFNLLPTLSSIQSCLNYCRAFSKQLPGATAKFSFRRCCYIEYKDKGGVDERAYEILMSSIVQRYFRMKELNIEE